MKNIHDIKKDKLDGPTLYSLQGAAKKAVPYSFRCFLSNRLEF